MIYAHVEYIDNLIRSYNLVIIYRNRQKGGGSDPQPPTIFLFRVNCILPTLRPWSQTFQGCSQDG